jgi:O-antigen ligase
MSNSRGAQLWLFAFSLSFLLAMAGIRISHIAYLCLAGCVAVVVMVMIAPAEILHYLEEVTTGRTRIWMQARKLFESAPGIGQGFGESYRSGPTFFDEFGNAYQGVHNGYITLLVDLGVVGFLVYLVMVITTIWAAGRIRGREVDALLSMLIAFIVYNLVESAIDKVTHLSFILFPLVLASCMQPLVRFSGDATDVVLDRSRHTREGHA